MIGASTGLFGAVWAQAELRKVLGAIGARVVDRELPVGLADDAFTEEGRLADTDQELILADLLAELAGELEPAPRGVSGRPEDAGAAAAGARYPLG